jgi:hypothetical protein
MRADTLSTTRTETLVNDYVRSVYNWMGITVFPPRARLDKELIGLD